MRPEPCAKEEPLVTESEILQGLFASIQTVLSLFSMFFTMTSAYIAGLYLFLNRAPLVLRLLAFALLSIGLIFLGGSAATLQRMQEGLFAAWSKLPAPIISIAELRNPIAVQLPLPGISMQEIGVAIGWIAASSVYLALGYLTFFYRWTHRSAER
jgi:hypothetical protein